MSVASRRWCGAVQVSYQLVQCSVQSSGWSGKFSRTSAIRRCACIALIVQMGSPASCPKLVSLPPQHSSGTPKTQPLALLEHPPQVPLPRLAVEAGGVVVLVLHLHGQDRPALAGEAAAEVFAQHAQPPRGLPQHRLAPGPQPGPGQPAEPRREAAEVDLRAAVRAHPQDHVEPGVRGLVDEAAQVQPAREVVDATLALVEVPEDVGLDRVEAQPPRALEELRPHCWCRARVVDRAREQQHAPAVHEQRAAVPAYAARRTTLAPAAGARDARGRGLLIPLRVRLKRENLGRHGVGLGGAPGRRFAATTRASRGSPVSLGPRARTARALCAKVRPRLRKLPLPRPGSR